MRYAIDSATGDTLRPSTVSAVERSGDTTLRRVRLVAVVAVSWPVLHALSSLAGAFVGFLF